MRSLAVTCVALCLAFLAATCSGRLLDDTVPTAALLVHETLMTKAVAVIVPTVEGAILNMKPITYKSVNFNVTDLKVSKFALGAVSVAFVAPNVVQATFPSVTLEIPPTAFTVGLGVNCDGSLGVVAQKEYLQANITLSRSPVNGSGALTTAVTARFDVLNITLAFTQGFLCEIAQSAIESYIRSTIESSLGPLISSKIQELGSEIFADLPLRFAADPEVTASGLETVVELLPRLAGPPVTVPLPPFTSIAARDVEVRVTQQSINDLLAALPRNGSVPLPSRFNTSADSLGHVWPKLVGFCTVAAACPLAVDYVLINPVNVTLSNQAALIATDNVFLTLSAVNGKTFVPALVVAATLEIAVSNISVVNQSVVDFKIGFPVIDGKLLSSAIGPLGDFQFYVSLLRVLLQGIVATAFNSAFKGLGPIGPLDDVIVQIGDSKVDIGLNVNVTGLRR